MWDAWPIAQWTARLFVQSVGKVCPFGGFFKGVAKDGVLPLSSFCFSGNQGMRWNDLELKHATGGFFYGNP